ncbi:U1 small nuclear ribonucleoprotein [Mycena vulgaris]|nr:U1 small nuclear ribonucleoprotein [Mycena vulgaris]
MPKHYCDYCDVFLTHDSTSVRKAHNSGRNHLSNVRDYYASLGPRQGAEHHRPDYLCVRVERRTASGRLWLRAPASRRPATGLRCPHGLWRAPARLCRTPAALPPERIPSHDGRAALPAKWHAHGPPGWIPGGAPPFPPNGPNAPPGAGLPPFPPSGAGFNGPPPANQPAPGPPPAPGSGPSIHPDRLRMMGGGR